MRSVTAFATPARAGTLITALAIVFNLSFASFSPVLAAQNETKTTQTEETVTVESTETESTDTEITEETASTDETATQETDSEETSTQESTEPTQETADTEATSEETTGETSRTEPSTTEVDSTEETTTEVEPSETHQSIYEYIETNKPDSVLLEYLEMLRGYEGCEAVNALISDATDITFFAPTDAALAAIAGDDSSAEWTELALEANREELCQLFSHHIVNGETITKDSFAGESKVFDTADFAPDTVTVTKTDTGINVDGLAATEVAKDEVDGVLYNINSVLLVEQAATINPKLTNSVSPTFSGSIDAGEFPPSDPMMLCVLVRINGVPHVAEVNGNEWTLNVDYALIDPTEENTLFDVVVREGIETCNEPIEQPADIRLTSHSDDHDGEHMSNWGGNLLGLTMSRSVLTYDPGEEPEEEINETSEDTGEVLGTDTEKNEVPVAFVASVTTTPACGKGVCPGQFGATGAGSNDAGNGDEDLTIDTDGDGVPDSRDPAPEDPTITGEEPADGEEDETGDQEDQDDGTNVILWILAGGAVAAVWYVLWQRGGLGKE